MAQEGCADSYKTGSKQCESPVKRRRSIEDGAPGSASSGVKSMTVALPASHIFLRKQAASRAQAQNNFSYKHTEPTSNQPEAWGCVRGCAWGWLCLGLHMGLCLGLSFVSEPRELQQTNQAVNICRAEDVIDTQPLSICKSNLRCEELRSPKAASCTWSASATHQPTSA